MFDDHSYFSVKAPQPIFVAGHRTGNPRISGQAHRLQRRERLAPKNQSFYLASSHSPVTSQREDSFGQETVAESTSFTKTYHMILTPTTPSQVLLWHKKQSVNLGLLPSMRDSHRAGFLQRNHRWLTGHPKCTRQEAVGSPKANPSNLTTSYSAVTACLSIGHTALTSISDRSCLREGEINIDQLLRCNADRFPLYSVYSLSPLKTGCKNGVNKIARAPSEEVGLGICGLVW